MGWCIIRSGVLDMVYPRSAGVCVCVYSRDG